MSLLSWNCQELGNPWTVCNLHKLVKDKASMVCFLMETRLDIEGFDWHCKELPYQNRLIIKKPNSGGWTCFHLEIRGELGGHQLYRYNVLARVVEEDSFEWFLTKLYGWLEASQKHKSWALLTHLMSFVNGPWMCIGDFNTILHTFEKQSRCPPIQSHMDEF